MNRKGVVPIRWLSGLLLVNVLLYLTGWLVYRHAGFALLPCLLSGLYPHWQRARKRMMREEQLRQQFQQVLYMLSASLSAGKSLESAVQDAERDVLTLYRDPQTAILGEWKRMLTEWRNGIPVEQAFFRLAARTGLSEIADLAETVAICKRQGGNLVEVTAKTAQALAAKLEAEREIAVMIAQKRWESRVICGVPIVFVVLLGQIAGGYMEPLYTTPGRILLTIALLLLGGCWWWCSCIMRIHV